MPTKLDLTDALDELVRRADEHPLPDFARLAAARRRPAPHRGRTGLLMVAATAAVAAVALIIVGLNRGGTTRPAATGRPPVPSHQSATSTPTKQVQLVAPRAFSPRSYYFSMDPVAGYKVTGGETFTSSHQINLDGTDGSHYDLTVNPTGAWTPDRPASAKSVTVSGRPGFYGSVIAPPQGVAVGDSVGLVWQYAPGAWAIIESWDKASIPLATALRLAAAVHPGTSSPLTVPVRSKPMPRNLTLQGTVITNGSTREGQHGPVGFDALIDYSIPGDDQSGTVLSIDIRTKQPNSAVDQGSHLTINGLPAIANSESVEITGSDFYADVQQTPLQPSGKFLLSKSELITIARGLTFASSIAKSDTWFDARSSLP